MSFSFEDLMQYDSMLPATPMPMLFEIKPATPKPYSSLMTPNVDRFEACILNEDDKTLISNQTKPSWWKEKPKSVQAEKKISMKRPPVEKTVHKPSKKVCIQKPASFKKISMEKPPKKRVIAEKKVSIKEKPPMAMVKMSPLLSPIASPPPEKEDLLSSISSNVSEKTFLNPKVVFSSTFSNEETLMPPDPPRKDLGNFRKLNMEMSQLQKVKRNLFNYKCLPIDFDFEKMKRERSERTRRFLKMVHYFQALQNPKPEKPKLPLKKLIEKINKLYKELERPKEYIFSFHPTALDYLEMCPYASREEKEEYYQRALKMAHFE